MRFILSKLISQENIYDTPTFKKLFKPIFSEQSLISELNSIP